jgi:drug/metabolite transporter (DMT)-like permease
MGATVGLLLAVFAISWASILVRGCGEVPGLVIAFYRMFWSTLFLLGYQMLRRKGGRPKMEPNPASRKWMLLAGVVLALHFVTWISAVQHTLISHALVLGSTHPIFALLLSPLLLRERGNSRAFLAAGLTLAGMALIGGQDWNGSGFRFQGDVLATVSALMFTIYLFIARHLRARVTILSYLISVYGSAALVLLFVMGMTGVPVLAYSFRSHLMMIGLALIPTLIGHSLLNHAARHMPAYRVNFSVLGEPVLASVLAFGLFGEVPRGWFYAGAVLVFLGMALALRSGTQPDESAREAEV